MANVEGAYSAVEDLLIGDIPLAARHGNGSGMIKRAAGEIEGQIGHIYETPIVVDPLPKNRPTVLLLSKINNLIASGRLLMDQAAAEEDDANHAYGASLLREGVNLLNAISSGKIELVGADRLDGPDEKSGPSIHNEDPESLVESFYRPRGVQDVLNPTRAYGHGMRLP